jgi:DNA repair exonuclease SbcCD ATPase subunit
MSLKKIYEDNNSLDTIIVKINYDIDNDYKHLEDERKDILDLVKNISFLIAKLNSENQKGGNDKNKKSVSKAFGRLNFLNAYKEQKTEQGDDLNAYKEQKTEQGDDSIMMSNPMNDPKNREKPTITQPQLTITPGQVLGNYRKNRKQPNTKEEQKLNELKNKINNFPKDIQEIKDKVEKIKNDAELAAIEIKNTEDIDKAKSDAGEVEKSAEKVKEEVNNFLDIIKEVKTSKDNLEYNSLKENLEEILNKENGDRNDIYVILATTEKAVANAYAEVAEKARIEIEKISNNILPKLNSNIVSNDIKDISDLANEGSRERDNINRFFDIANNAIDTSKKALENINEIKKNISNSSLYDDINS